MIVTGSFNLCGNHRFVTPRLEARIVKIAADIAWEAEDRSTT